MVEEQVQSRKIKRIGISEGLHRLRTIPVVCSKSPGRMCVILIAFMKRTRSKFLVSFTGHYCSTSIVSLMTKDMFFHLSLSLSYFFSFYERYWKTPHARNKRFTCSFPSHCETWRKVSRKIDYERYNHEYLVVIIEISINVNITFHAYLLYICFFLCYLQVDT